jgi:nitroreductase
MPTPDALDQFDREEEASTVEVAIRSRKSVRAFRPIPVARSEVEELLQLASRSASGSNIQPWRVKIIAGDVKARLTQVMYNLLGVTKGDFEGTQRSRLRNFEFFGAPVGMIFTLDEDLEMGSWLDLGIYLGTLMIAARGRGLHTCAQAAFADFHRIIRPMLGIPNNEIIICGMALGHMDPDAPVNRLQTERAHLSEFTTFEGF